MGTGTFDFKNSTIQALLVEQVGPVVSLEGHILRNSQSFYKNWEIEPTVAAEFRVLMNSGTPLTFRSSAPLPDDVVRRCREIVGSLNWLNTLSGKAVGRARERITRELDCKGVWDSLHVAKQLANTERVRFAAQLEETIAETNDKLVALVMGRKILLPYLS